LEIDKLFNFLVLLRDAVKVFFSVTESVHPHVLVQYHKVCAWQCNLCKEKFIQDKTKYKRFLCGVVACDYDICEPCWVGTHPHPFVPGIHHNVASCSRCHGILDTNSYKCAKACELSLCLSCYSLAHPHPCSMQHMAMMCDVCKQKGTTSYRCKMGCDYDICECCWKQQKHPHFFCELGSYPAKCDMCGNTTREDPSFYHCGVGCDYDLCKPCFLAGGFPLKENYLIKSNEHVPILHPLPPPVESPPVIQPTPPSSPKPNPPKPIEEPSDDAVCIICYAEPRKVLFLPCKHLICCALCAPDVRSTRNLCPKCNSSIVDAIDVFL